ncbi:MAG: metal-dependent hydrolase [Pirellulaceae bacterium]
MAGFKTHIGTSTLLGIGYGAAGYLVYEIPATTCMLAGGLCSVAGMLPDVDSDNGVPLRETTAFIAAVTPMLALEHLQHYGEQHGLTNESLVLATALIYVIMRFGVGEIIRRVTVHRGMWHSIPAAVIASLSALFLCTCGSNIAAAFKAGGVFLGYMSHLVLDEIYSIQWKRGRFRLKNSFGTAIKMWGPGVGANLMTYAQLVGIVYVLFGANIPPTFRETPQAEIQPTHETAQDLPPLTIPLDLNR